MSTTSRSVRSNALGLLLLAAGVGWPVSASAADAPPIELAWQAPEGCPGSEVVLERVRQLAGKGGAGGGPLAAEAVVSKSADGQFQLELVVRSGTLVGRRSMKGRSCNDLVGAVAVALALLLSPEQQQEDAAALADATPEAERASPEPQPPGVTPPAVDAADAPAASTTLSGDKRRWRGLLTLPMASLGVGPERRAVVGLGLGAGVSFERWRFHAEGRLWADTQARATPSPEDYGATLSRSTLSVRGCRSLGATRFEIGPCVLVSLQHLSAMGSGAHIAPRTPKTTWLASGLGLRARYLLAPWFGLVAAVDGEVQFSRPEVKLQGVGSVERLAPLSATLSIGTEWIL